MQKARASERLLEKLRFPNTVRRERQQSLAKKSFSLLPPSLSRFLTLYASVSFSCGLNLAFHLKTLRHTYTRAHVLARKQRKPKDSREKDRERETSSCVWHCTCLSVSTPPWERKREGEPLFRSRGAIHHSPGDLSSRSRCTRALHV